MSTFCPRIFSEYSPEGKIDWLHESTKVRKGRCEIAVALQWNEEVHHPCTCAARALSDFFEHTFFVIRCAACYRIALQMTYSLLSRGRAAILARDYAYGADCGARDEALRGA